MKTSFVDNPKGFVHYINKQSQAPRVDKRKQLSAILSTYSRKHLGDKDIFYKYFQEITKGTDLKGSDYNFHAKVLITSTNDIGNITQQLGEKYDVNSNSILHI
jgi:hypothetical protein